MGFVIVLNCYFSYKKKKQNSLYAEKNGCFQDKISSIHCFTYIFHEHGASIQ